MVDADYHSLAEIKFDLKNHKTRRNAYPHNILAPSI